jgi:DICT domain-containing protein
MEKKKRKETILPEPFPGSPLLLLGFQREKWKRETARRYSLCPTQTLEKVALGSLM